MNERSQAAACIEAFTALINRDPDRAIRIISAYVLDDNVAFGWACGYAGALTACIPGPTNARIIAELELAPGASDDPDLDEALDLSAAFVAAIGNDDVPGAHALWRALEVQGRAELLFTIGNIAAIAVRARADSI